MAKVKGVKDGANPFEDREIADQAVETSETSTVAAGQAETGTQYEVPVIEHSVSDTVVIETVSPIEAEELNCINDDCLHFDKSLPYGCGCGLEPDDPPFDISGCINRIPAEVPQDGNNITPHVCNIELGPEFTRFLPTPVPDDILADYARDMARLHSLWVKTKLDAKAFAKACKEVTDNCEDQEIKLAEIVGSGTEETEVSVRWSFDFSQNIKRLVRQDTMEVVEEAPMTAEDRQGDLFGRMQESIENVQNCLGEGAGLEAGGDISPEQDTQEPSEGENVLETKSDASDEIGGNDGVSFPSQEELDKDWPVPGPDA